MAEPRSSSSKMPSGAKSNRAGIEFDVSEFMQSMECSENHLVMGIDEAGRGPVVGPMVYTGAMIALHEHDRLVDYCGANDSKVLNEDQRKSVVSKLHELATFRTFTVVVTPDEIAAAMTGAHGTNLNTLSHQTAISIISKLTLEGMGMLTAAYVDTVGPPESYQQKLSGRFPHLRVTVAKKAEIKFPIVAAASVVAKVERDSHIERLGIDVGSGYPSDPKVMMWVRSHVHRFFVMPRECNFVRLSWAPVTQLANDPETCIPIVFEEDTTPKKERKQSKCSGDGKKQKLLSFVKPAPRRHFVYTHLLKLRTIAGIRDTHHTALSREVP
ncbi:ribonuclease H, putative [Trypanosoma brucei brucei TREU927]|uniref:Ribonuclease n=1 Tax=Trypanosoma brucei brucei (strain 927/4 GUTat10.1) TaxID=185431 RepID=Q38B94_TRYB2|nr:ribonuclease H, putative [Trypanosoma brucei brucei TREU927]EAN77926.1 ribonuclease H, putative [Trypanosoma brucei brucei TREU927]